MLLRDNDFDVGGATQRVYKQHISTSPPCKQWKTSAREAGGVPPSSLQLITVLAIRHPVPGIPTGVGRTWTHNAIVAPSATPPCQKIRRRG